MTGDVKNLVKPTLELGNAVYDLAVRSGQNDLAAELGRQAMLWKSPDLSVVITGRAGTGKSTLLDCLLTDPVFAEGGHAPTRTHVVIRYAADREMLAHPVDADAPERVPPVPCMQVPDGHFTSVEIGIPDPLLEAGVRFVDTPGIDAYETSQQQITRAAVALADVLVFVTDASAPLSAPELEFLGTALRTVSGIVVALARTDAARDWRGTLRADGDLVAAELGADGVVDLVPVSSRLHMRGRERAAAGDDAGAFALFERAGTAALRRMIEAQIDAREALRLGNILRLSRSVLTHLEEAERGRLENDSELAVLEEQLAGQSALAEEFSSVAAIWRQELAHQFQDLAYEAIEEITRQTAGLQTRYEALIRDSGDTVGRLAEAIPTDIDACLRATWIEVVTLLARRLEEICLAIAERFDVPGFEIVFDDLSMHDRVTVITTQRAAPEQHSSATWEYLRASWPAIGMGSLGLRLAPLIGLTGATALVATPVLTAAALFAGGMLAKNTLRTTRAARDRQEVSRYVSTVLAQAKADMTTTVNRQLAAVRQHMQQRIDTVLRDRKRDLTTQMQNLRDMRSLATASRNTERTNAKKRLARIDRLGQRAAALENALDAALTRSDGPEVADSSHAGAASEQESEAAT